MQEQLRTFIEFIYVAALREWGSATTAFLNLVTIAAVLSAGAWAVYRYYASEKLRKQQQIPSPDGYLKATCTPLGSDKLIVSLEATWRNRGVIPIELNDESSFVSGFEINKKHAVGSLNTQSSALNARLFEGPYTLQPQTESVMHHQFVVEKGAVYLFHVKIVLDEKKLPGDEKNSSKGIQATNGNYYCSRKIVVDTTNRSSSSTSSKD